MKLLKKLNHRARNDTRWRSWLAIVPSENFQEQVQNVDEDYVAVRNLKADRYEIHGFGPGRDTFQIAVPWPTLDGRTIERLWETSFKYHDAAKRLRDHNARIQAGKDKDFHNDIEARTIELQKDMSLVTERSELHDSYKRTHTVGGLA